MKSCSMCPSEMNQSLVITNSPVQSCCSQSPSTIVSITESRTTNRLEVICRVALGAFAAYVNWTVGIISLAVGTLGGVACHLFTLIHTGLLPESGNRRPICAQGYMENLSGMTFSSTMNQLATATFIAVHIKHYPPFFVPFTGLFVGMWLGGKIVEGAWNIAQRC